MKSFDEIYDDVIKDPNTKAFDVFPEVCRRYATQVANDVLNRAAERVDVITGYSADIETTILKTEIILP